MRNGQELNQIRAERARAGLTLEQLAEKSGIPRSTLARYQDSEHVPMSAVNKIADALNLPASALLSKRELPADDKLSYDQLSLQMQAAQQYNIYCGMICDKLHRTNRLLLVIVLILAVFLFYILVDRFAFPDAGIFHAGN